MAVLAACAAAPPEPVAPVVRAADLYRILALEVEVAPRAEITWPKAQRDLAFMRLCREATLSCDDPLTRPRTKREYMHARIGQLVNVEAGAAIAPKGRGDEEAVAVVLVRALEMAAGGEAYFTGGSNEMVAELTLVDPSDRSVLMSSGPIAVELDAGEALLFADQPETFEDPAPATVRAWGERAAVWLGTRPDG